MYNLTLLNTGNYLNYNIKLMNVIILGLIREQRIAEQNK